jgi:hypothetical protein
MKIHRNPEREIAEAGQAGRLAGLPNPGRDPWSLWREWRNAVRARLLLSNSTNRESLRPLPFRGRRTALRMKPNASSVPGRGLAPEQREPDAFRAVHLISAGVSRCTQFVEVLPEPSSQTLRLGVGNEPFFSGVGDCLLGEIDATPRL